MSSVGQDPHRDVELAILRLSWRVDALDAWRKELDTKLLRIEAQVSEIVSSERIADEVALRLATARDARRRLELTFLQKFAVVVVSLVSLAGAAKEFIG